MNLINKKWEIPEGTVAKLKFFFDDRSPKIATFYYINKDIMGANSGDSGSIVGELISNFADANRFSILFPNGERLAGALDGTRAAVNAWLQCGAEWAGTGTNDARAPANDATPEAPPASVANNGPAEETVYATGTGIVVNAAGYISTNAHVVAGCDSVHVDIPEHSFDAHIVALDKQNDLSLLKVDHEFSNAAVFSTSSVKLGSKVSAFGFPLLGALASGGNFTVGQVSALTGMYDDSRFVQMTTPVQPGNSGGPLLDEDGHLVGVVTAKLNAVEVAKATGDVPQNVNFAIRGQVLRTFIEANGIEVSGGEKGPAKQDTEIAAIGRSISTLVKCAKKPPS
jgi:S1-C subfamily serine protease